MSLADLLYAVLAFQTIGYIPVGVVMFRAAKIRPAIWALTLFTGLTVTIAVVVIVYVLAVANSLLGFPVPLDAAKVILRLVFIPLAAFPYFFAWVYLTGRFRDGQ